MDGITVTNPASTEDHETCGDTLLGNAIKRAGTVSRSTHRDSGWSWVVCFACFLVHVIFDGIYFSFGIVFVELLEFFHRSKRDTSVIASLCFGVAFMCGPIYAFLSNRFGCRVVVICGSILCSCSFILNIFAPSIYLMYITFGVMAGFGYGCVYQPSVICVNYYFSKKRAIATGLGTCGSGIGAIIFGPVTRLLIERYTWKGAILIQASLLLNGVAFGLVYLPIETKYNSESDHVADGNGIDLHEDDGNMELSSKSAYDKLDHDSASPDQARCERVSTRPHENCEKMAVSCKERSKRKTALHRICDIFRDNYDITVFRNIPFLLELSAVALFCISYLTPYIFLPDKVKQTGIEEGKGAWLISAIGFSKVFGHVLSGAISDIKYVNRLYVFIAAMFVCGLVLVLMAIVQSMAALVTCSIAFGLAIGSVITLNPVLITDFVGSEKMAEAYGSSNFVGGLTALVGAPLIGWLCDITGSYNSSFIAAGVIMIVGSVLVCLIPVCRLIPKT